MNCKECIHKSVCYRVDYVQSDYAQKCGDFVSGCKALEQEPCDDTISRQAVDDAIYEYSRSCDVNYGQIMEYIDKVPPVTPKQKMEQWIPVSERLPEVGSEVLVCFDFKGRRSVYISNFYGDGEFHGLDDEYLTPEGRKYRKAVAWMPLPEPYKGGE